MNVLAGRLNSSSGVNVHVDVVGASRRQNVSIY